MKSKTTASTCVSIAKRLQQKCFANNGLIWFHIVLLCCSLFSTAQNKKTVINPKGQWYFGIEMGRNRILSNDFNSSATTFVGIAAEYYFDKYWSIQSKIQWYKTEVAFADRSTFLSNGTTPYQSMYFNGRVLSVPIIGKWEFKIKKNFRGFLFLGAAYNFETQSDYDIPNVVNPDLSHFPKQYISGNMGWGLTYALSKKASVYFSEGFNFGGYKGREDRFLSNSKRIASNNLSVIGIKYHFKH